MINVKGRLIKGPYIVREGMVLYLDAGNTKSYPGSGTTWADLSGNGNTGTLTNGPTYNSANGGSIVFDGVDDYVSESNFLSKISSGFTLVAWVNFTNASSPSNQKIIHIQNGQPEVNIDNYNGGSGNPKLHFYTAASGSGNNIMTSGEDIVNNTWYNVVGVYDDNTKFKYIYVNGTIKNSGTTTVKISWPNSVAWIGRRLDTSEPFNGRISSVKIYNRALTATEVLQNYNALRSRFGI